jgi:integrase
MEGRMNKYRLLKMNSRGGRYYAEEIETGLRKSLKTADCDEAEKLLHALNESNRNPHLNQRMAHVYLAGSDPDALTRTWEDVTDAIIASKPAGSDSRYRWTTASKDTAYGLIRVKPLLSTTPDLLLAVLKKGTVSTNVYLRRIQNFALDMGWLPWPILRKKQFPKVRFKPKRGITECEHRRIIGREINPERRDFYELCWLLGGSQGDIASLTDEDIDWSDRLICYNRKKMLQRMQENPNLKPPMIKYGKKIEAVLKGRPSKGPLFPRLRTARSSDRATEFKQRCRGLGIEGVTLHSYRYGWAERARKAYYPQRCAQENLGQQSPAVHRAYAKNAAVTIPSLDEWEELVANKIIDINQMPKVA